MSRYDTFEIPAGRTSGIAIGMPTNYWIPGSVTRLPNPKSRGFKGLVIQGQGVDQSFLELDDYGASLMYGDDCGVISARDCTIVGAKGWGIKAGSKKGDWKSDPNGGDPIWVPGQLNLFPDSMLRLFNVRLMLNANTPKWFVDSTNVDHFWVDVEVDVSCERLGEHLLYAHGVADRGVYWKRVRVAGTGAEIAKVCTREWEAHYAPNAIGHFEMCSFRNFGARWGGAAFSMQGSGLQTITIEMCVVEGRPNGASQPVDRMLGLADGLSSRQNAENNQRRAYDVNTGLPAGKAPAGWCANGDVVVRDSAFLGFGGHPEMETYSGYPNYQTLGIEQHYMARSLRMEGCVMVDGNAATNGTSIVKFPGVRNDDITIRGNNTPELLEMAEHALGWPIAHETLVSIPGMPTKPLSQVNQ